MVIFLPPFGSAERRRFGSPIRRALGPLPTLRSRHPDCGEMTAHAPGGEGGLTTEGVFTQVQKVQDILSRSAL